MEYFSLVSTKIRVNETEKPEYSTYIQNERKNKWKKNCFVITRNKINP